jgi:hypothetical protein
MARAPEPMARASADAAYEEYEQPKDYMKDLLEIITPYMDHILADSSDTLESLLRPVEGKYSAVKETFDGIQHLKLSAKGVEYLHQHSKTFAAILYAGLLYDDIQELQNRTVVYDIESDVIPILFNTYYYFIKGKISKTLKQEISNFCLMYIQKYKDDVIEMLREIYPTLDPERVYTDSLDHAERVITADIDKYSSKSQPESVFNVSGMNMAPSGPSPAAPKVLKTKAKSGLRPRSETQFPQAGDPRIFAPPDGDVGGSMKRLVKTSKKHLSLPYFDNHDDPYVFRNK